MNKLNWRDASKELPERSDLITHLVIDVNNKYKPTFIAAFDGKNFWINTGDYGAEKITATHWLPLNEIPLPKE